MNSLCEFCGSKVSLFQGKVLDSKNREEHLCQERQSQLRYTDDGVELKLAYTRSSYSFADDDLIYVYKKPFTAATLKFANFEGETHLFYVNYVKGKISRNRAIRQQQWQANLEIPGDAAIARKIIWALLNEHPQHHLIRELFAARYFVKIGAYRANGDSKDTEALLIRCLQYLQQSDR